MSYFKMTYKYRSSFYYMATKVTFGSLFLVFTVTTSIHFLDLMTTKTIYLTARIVICFGRLYFWCFVMAPLKVHFVSAIAILFPNCWSCQPVKIYKDFSDIRSRVKTEKLRARPKSDFIGSLK